jgi:hypothetical protein
MVLEKLFQEDQPIGGGVAGTCFAGETAVVGRRLGRGAWASASMDKTAITAVFNRECFSTNLLFAIKNGKNINPSRLFAAGEKIFIEYPMC